MSGLVEGTLLKIVIGGGAGFIGAPLGRALVAMGHKVTAADNLSTGFRISRDKDVELAKGDLDQSRFLVRIFEKLRPDLYVHLAGQKDVSASWEDPSSDSTHTVGSFLGVLGACRTMTVPRILLVSTGEVLTPPEGSEDRPLDPLLPIRPLSPYGASHALCEFYLDSFARFLPMKTTIVRLAPVFGPGQTTVGEGGLIGLAIRQTLLKNSQNPPAIPGNGRRMRDYIFIDDAVEALLHLIIKEKEGVFHVGSGIPQSDRDIFLALGKVLGSTYPVHYQPAPFPETEVRILGHDRLLMETDWTMEVPFQEGISRTVDFFRKAIQ